MLLGVPGKMLLEGPPPRTALPSSAVAFIADACSASVFRWCSGTGHVRPSPHAAISGRDTCGTSAGRPSRCGWVCPEGVCGGARKLARERGGEAGI